MHVSTVQVCVVHAFVLLLSCGDTQHPISCLHSITIEPVFVTFVQSIYAAKPET